MSTDAVNNVTVEAKKKAKAAPKKAQAAAVEAEASTSNLTLEDKVEKLTELVNSLVKRIEVLESNATDVAPVTNNKGKKDKEDKKPRAPSAYNLFMKEKMGELKDSHPDLNNIERMKMAAESWSASKTTNPESE